VSGITILGRALKRCHPPVLIHCLAGADRTSLAAAIWWVVIDGKPKSEVKKQLSFVYGHIPFGPTKVPDEFFEKLAIPTKLNMNGKKMTGELFNRGEYADD
jgi:protein tyrosine/serine phosphatase